MNYSFGVCLACCDSIYLGKANNKILYLNSVHDYIVSNTVKDLLLTNIVFAAGIAASNLVIGLLAIRMKPSCQQTKHEVQENNVCSLPNKISEWSV